MQPLHSLSTSPFRTWHGSVHQGSQADWAAAEPAASKTKILLLIILHTGEPFRALGTSCKTSASAGGAHTPCRNGLTCAALLHDKRELDKELFVMFHAPHVAHQAAVGGTVPGYAGHRPVSEDPLRPRHTLSPGPSSVLCCRQILLRCLLPSSDPSSLLPLRPQLAAQTHGETAWGGVPQRLDEAVPGQGVSLPRTTAFEEVGQPYKPHEHNRTEAFRAAVGGIKVGYGGHVPGERNHFGSNHQGQLPRVEYSEPAQSHASLPGPPSEGEIRKMEFEPAWHLAQATGTAKQHFEVHHRSGRSAPFGLDSINAPYVTEQSRPLGTGGPRGQLMTRANGGSSRATAMAGREGASGGVLSEFHGLQRHAAGAARAQPGAVAQSLYDRDVNGQRAVRVSEFVYSPPHALPLAVGNASGNADLTQHAGSASIGLQHSASPGSRGGSRLNQFINGAGAMDDWVDAPHAGFPAPPDVTASRAMRARQPSHAYETEMLSPRGSYHLSHSGVEREAPRRGIVVGGGSTPPPQQGDKYRSRISSNQRDSCLLYTSPSPRDRQKSRMPSSA